MSLYSLTLDYIVKNLPENVVDDIKCKVLNKNYDPDAKQTKFLLHFPKIINGHPILYWMFLTLPDMFEQCAIILDKKQSTDHIKQWFGDNWFIDNPELIIPSSGSYIFSKTTKKFYSDSDFYNEFYWYDISTALYDKLDKEVKKHCHFIDVRTDDNVLSQQDRILHVSSTYPEYPEPGVTITKVGEYHWRAN